MKGFPGPLAVCVVAACIASCIPDPGQGILPRSDLDPPFLLEAGPEDARTFIARFDEAVSPVNGSFALNPGGSIMELRALGERLVIALPVEQEAGADYALAGEVEDSGGNRTRMVISFCGWNGRVPKLRISELFTARNSSKTRPHRDYVELEALSEGNLGGVELAWASSVKAYSYRFPGAELRAGDLVVLHLAPEGRAEERDERGSDLGLSGGVDSSPGARDFWSGAGGLSDASGALTLRPRPGDRACDGIFYAEDSRTGAIEEGRLLPLLRELQDASIWQSAGGQFSWEDAFRWRPSTARSICRSGQTGSGPAVWYLSDSGAQSPGQENPMPVQAEAKRVKRAVVAAGGGRGKGPATGRGP